MNTPIQILIPMAGRGKRFADVGYGRPKPLIDVAGQPMIQRVVENLRPDVDHRFVFVVLEEHIAEHLIDALLESIAPGCTVVAIPEVTDGAARTALFAMDSIEPDLPLVIANSDQYVRGGLQPLLDSWEAAGSQVAGFIMTMRDTDPKWSFVRLDSNGIVTEVVEKVPVSDQATVGIYLFRSAAHFARAATAMISADDRTNGEFYVAPAYNYLIDQGLAVGHLDMGPVGEAVFGLGTPDDLGLFLDAGVPL